MESHDKRRLTAVSAAAQRLRVDYAAAAAIDGLNARGIHCILLKGASITQWLFDAADGRSYADCDLLVSPADFRSAVNVLSGLGFAPQLDEVEMPAWSREHALTAVRENDGAAIDIHRNLPGARVSEERLWSTLSADTETITVGETDAAVLTEPGRAVHVALHAAQHGGSPRDLEVLERAIERMDHGVWEDAVKLARSLHAEAAFQRGLCFLPEGAVLADRLGLVSVASDIDVELRAAGVPEALTLARLLKTRGAAARAAFVARKLVPPVTFMRKWSPLARRSRLGLAASYLWRPIWVAARVPSAVSGWARARRR